MSDAAPNSPSTPGSANASPREIDVLYLPLLPRHRHALRVVVPALVALAVLVGVVAATARRHPGDAVWETQPRTFQGVVIAEPAAMLVVERDGTPHAMLLVEEGKRGAADRARARDGQRVVATGRVLSRDGVEVLELLAGEAGLAPDASATSIPPPTIHSTSPAPVTLRGEVIDPKCYHGAMKPGEGKTHKACATLCIRGGIPPMFIWHDERGTPQVALLVRATGQMLDDATLSMVGEPIELQGTRGSVADMGVITMVPGTARRVR